MDAQLEHLLKLINADIDNPDSTDDSEKRPASDTDLELLDAYSRAVVAVVDTAPLNPGNSGGPLVDSAGKVVGIK